MAYDETLARRVRDHLGRCGSAEERKMFGGIAFMVGGHMCCGVAGDELVLRIGAENAADAVKRPHVRYCDFTGRPMKTMVTVAPPGIETGRQLDAWVALAHGFATSQPPKKPKRRK